MRRVRGGWVPAAVLAIAGCGDAPEAPPDAIRTDSAGVEVVETPEAIWTAEEAWTVDPEPELSVGRVEGDEAYLFGEITGVVRLDDGRLAVADGQARRIRLYDSDGTYLHEMGGPGDGPGEFRSLSDLWHCGSGRIYAWDRLRRRVSAWRPDGVLQREFALLEPESENQGSYDSRGPYRTSCGPTGEIIAAGWGDTSGLSSMTESSFFPQEAPIWVLDSIGEVVLHLGEHVVSERVFLFNESTGGGSSGPHPLGRFASFALGSERVWVGTAERLEVRAYDGDGELAGIFRGPSDDLDLTPELLDRYAAAAAEAETPDAALLERIRGLDLELPPGLPAYTEMLVDSGRRLWARRFRFPWDEAERWAVFGATGEFLGHVRMPPGLEVHQIGADHVTGVAADALGVQQARVHRLRRGEEAG